MNFLHLSQSSCECSVNTLRMRDMAPRKAVILAKFDWSNPAVHIKYRLTTSPNDMDMSRVVIVWIDNRP